MKRCHFVSIVIVTICLFVGCKEKDAPAYWPLDVESGFRLFIGVCDYSYEDDNPEVSVLINEANTTQDFQLLEKSDCGVTVAGKLYYYYDLSDDWIGKSVCLVVVYSSTEKQYTTVVELDNERNLWFIVEDNGICRISAPVSKENP
ncbi:MAG: hypothetical protein IJK44_08255 [Bacteroidales bacterium]|nr:hypothetical protein [Bacteroidales bacterium]